MRLNRNETLRYLGMSAAEPDELFLSRLEVVEEAILAAARPNACWLLVPVEVKETSCLVGNLNVLSRDLAKMLGGCSRAFLFAATLGTNVDALLRRYGQIAPADLVMAQAVATALIETYCDSCQEEMQREVPGEVLCPRFSPGYGDFPLAYQTDLFAALDVTKRIGVTLTTAQLMVPSKSISAILGCGHKGESL